MRAFDVALPDPRPGLGGPEEGLGPGTLLVDGVATVSRPLLVACWMARASALERAPTLTVTVSVVGGGSDIALLCHAAKLVTSRAKSRAYGAPLYLMYLYIYLRLTYISPAVFIYLRLYLYISGCTYISPAVFIYLWLYLYISGCTYISLAVLIYLRLYVYISGWIYYIPVVFLYTTIWTNFDTNGAP